MYDVTELRDRLENAVVTLNAQIEDLPKDLSIGTLQEVHRLAGKIEGVKLAIDYLR